MIPNAIDTEKYRFNPEIRDEVRCSLGIQDKFVIGHIGRFVYQKNHDFLIDIFNEVHKQNHNAVLLIIGVGILLHDVKSKVHRLGLDNAVMFLGVRQDAYKFYQAFDVFLLPSRYEGLGIVAIEAQTSGLPVICSDNVPQETKISNNIFYLSINNNLMKWTNITLNVLNKNRIIEIRTDIFDIFKQAYNLEQRYIMQIKQKGKGN